jgi:hypothetical protein
LKPLSTQGPDSECRQFLHARLEEIHGLNNHQENQALAHKLGGGAFLACSML